MKIESDTPLTLKEKSTVVAFIRFEAKWQQRLNLFLNSNLKSKRNTISKKAEKRKEKYYRKISNINKKIELDFENRAYCW